LRHNHKRITTEEDRRAPEGKYRVILNDRREDDPVLYFVSDHDTAEEAFVVAEDLDNYREKRNGIVQGSNDWVLYPWFDDHQLLTREELLAEYGRETSAHESSNERPLTTVNVDAIEKKQAERIPGWQPGHRLVVFWRDIAKATGAVAHPGSF